MSSQTTTQLNGYQNGAQAKPKRLFVGSPFTSFYTSSSSSSNGYSVTEKNGKFAEDAAGALPSLRKLGEQHSYVGALLLVLVFSIILSRVAVFMGEL